eukprot:6207459-Pleurochrysis_carterae.AAC.1
MQLPGPRPELVPHFETQQRAKLTRTENFPHKCSIPFLAHRPVHEEAVDPRLRKPTHCEYRLLTSAGD